MTASQRSRLQAKLKSQITEDLEKHLPQKYLLITRSSWWAFLGGMAAFCVAVGFVSYQSALKAVSDPAVQAAIETIKKNESESAKSLAAINGNWEASKSSEQRLQALESFVVKEEHAKALALAAAKRAQDVAAAEATAAAEAAAAEAKRVADAKKTEEFQKAVRKLQAAQSGNIFPLLFK